MASHKWPGRILRIDEADTSVPGDERRSEPAGARRKNVPSKPCFVPGCSGTMHFREALQAPYAPHTLEWRWYASWRCEKDTTHWQLISD